MASAEVFAFLSVDICRWKDVVEKGWGKGDNRPSKWRYRIGKEQWIKL